MIRYGKIERYERELDLRAGMRRRMGNWTSSASRAVKSTTVRLVSLTQWAMAALSDEVASPDAPVCMVVQSQLANNEALPELTCRCRYSGTA